MSYAIARPIALLAIASGSVWLIARYRLLGVMASILLGSCLLFFAYQLWPVPPSEWDEDGEEIFTLAPLLMTVWCFPVWLVIGVLTDFKKGGKFCP